MSAQGIIAGRRVLVVEDEYFLADRLARDLCALGAEVVGPVPSVDDALDLVEGGARLDGAVLDINLQGEMVYPVADALRARGVPFVFATGYDRTSIPAPYREVPRCEKPVDAQRIAAALAALRQRHDQT